ncbi:MAG: DEAD/DEAH box helicase, partial [Actinomycetota bacterium]
HDAIRAHLAQAGASFWADIVRATGSSPGGAGGVPDERSLLASLWDLVWSGEITNDTLAPLRALGWGKPRRDPKGRPRPGSIKRAGPATAAGRWSLVNYDPQPAPTVIAHAKAMQLLDRHGVLTREAALAEGVEGGFAGIYPVLRALEEAGRVRRGYFVAGLGAAQFALPGAVERLREFREPSTSTSALAIAATDPAQPYGASLQWPESSGRPARAAGAYVVLIDGACAAYLERGGRSLLTFGVDGPWAEAVASLQKEGRVRSIVIEKINGGTATTAPEADALQDAGFSESYKGLSLRG